jgi:putative Ca2+/H+ antiporter (TMEM165/GDT1 family)
MSRPLDKRQAILLGLTVVGFVVPNTMIGIFTVDHGGFSPAVYFGAWFDSLPAAQLALDLSIAFVAFALWAAWDGRRLRMRSWWVPIPASVLIGVCFALPLFLFLRERKLAEPGCGTHRPRDPLA